MSEALCSRPQQRDNSELKSILPAPPSRKTDPWTPGEGPGHASYPGISRTGALFENPCIFLQGGGLHI